MASFHFTQIVIPLSLKQRAVTAQVRLTNQSPRTLSSRLERNPFRSDLPSSGSLSSRKEGYSLALDTTELIHEDGRQQRVKADYTSVWLSGKGQHRFEYAQVAHDADWLAARIP